MSSPLTQPAKHIAIFNRADRDICWPLLGFAIFMLIKPLQLSLRLGISWFLPVELSVPARLATGSENSHKQHPGAIWRARSQPRSRGLFGLNTILQVQLSLDGKSQRTSASRLKAVQRHLVLPSITTNTPRNRTPASWGW